MLPALPVLPTLLTDPVDMRRGSFSGVNDPALALLVGLLWRGGVETGKRGAGGGIVICPEGGGGTSAGRLVRAAEDGLHAIPPIPILQICQLLSSLRLSLQFERMLS